MPTNDGPQKKDTRLEELDRLIAAEENEWRRAGMSIQNVNFDLFAINCRLLAIERFLIGKEFVEQEQANINIREVILEQLQFLRAQIQPELERKRLIPPIGIEIPDHIKRNMN